MQVHTLFFGITREIVGRRQMMIELPDNCTVADFRFLMQERFPELSDLDSLAIAVEGSYANETTRIIPNSEVAIIPPVSGG